MTEQQVLLEAVSATSAFDELGVKGCRIEPDRRLSSGSRLFKGDNPWLEPMELAQHRERRLAWAVIADAL